MREETSTVSLAPLRRFRGRVLNPDGTPAVQAEISTMPSWVPAASTFTATDGSFTLITADPHVCARLGHLSATATLAETASTEVTLHPSARYAGVVVDQLDGGPLAGVLIELEAGSIIESTSTNETGRFELAAPCEDRATFTHHTWARFSRRGYVTGHADVVPDEGDREAPTPPPSEVTVPLEASATVRGVVVDDHGVPAPYALVGLCSLRPERVVADGEGRFSIADVKREDCIEASAGLRAGSLDLVTAPGEVLKLRLELGEPMLVVPLEILSDDEECPNHVWNVHASRRSGKPFQTDFQWSAQRRHHDVLYGRALHLPAGTYLVTATSAFEDDGCAPTQGTLVVDGNVRSPPAFELRSNLLGH